MNDDLHYNIRLILSVVKKGMARKVVAASKKAGARGGTITRGRGTGVNEMAKLLGVTIEPEKEVIFTLVGQDTVDEVLEAIIAAGKLNKPGFGIALVVKVKKIAGCVGL